MSKACLIVLRWASRDFLDAKTSLGSRMEPFINYIIRKWYLKSQTRVSSLRIAVTSGTSSCTTVTLPSATGGPYAATSRPRERKRRPYPPILQNLCVQYL